MIPASVSQSVSHEKGCAKTAERIDVPIGVETPGDPRNIVLMGIPSRGEGGSMQPSPNYYGFTFYCRYSGQLSGK